MNFKTNHKKLHSSITSRRCHFASSISSMAASTNFAFAVFFASSLLVQSALGDIRCETLSKDECAFAVSSSGDRCVLETYKTKGRFTGYQCKTSEVMMADERLAGYIETEQCIKACGVDRTTVGLGSDSLLEAVFVAKLCSPECYQNCANIVDLYFSLAAGEGAYLPDLCKAQQGKGEHHRAMFELLSSNETEKDEEDAFAPAPAPSEWN